MEGVGYSPQDLYEWAAYLAVIIISAVLFFIAHLCERMSHIPRNKTWKRIFHVSAVLCAICAVVRFVVVLAFFDDYAMRLALPMTAVASWLVIAGIGWAVVRYIESVAKRVTTTRQNIDLTEAVFEEVVRPLIRGEDVPLETVKSFKKASARIAA